MRGGSGHETRSMHGTCLKHMLLVRGTVSCVRMTWALTYLVWVAPPRFRSPQTQSGSAESYCGCVCVCVCVCVWIDVLCRCTRKRGKAEVAQLRTQSSEEYEKLLNISLLIPNGSLAWFSTQWTKQNFLHERSMSLSSNHLLCAKGVACMLWQYPIQNKLLNLYVFTTET